ncbi:hypothetical protein OROGR_023591 [Orobanche gracilis]
MYDDEEDEQAPKVDEKRKGMENMFKRTLTQATMNNMLKKGISDEAQRSIARHGEMLMNKRKKIWWTPCAAHCIDLMLEEFEKKIPVHAYTIYKGRRITTFIYGRPSLISLLQEFTEGRDLVRPDITRFATSYLTLGCLNDYKGSLKKMFASPKWKATKYARTQDGRLIEDVIDDNEFWANIIFVLKAAFPLMRVLRMVDFENLEKPAMGYIYEAMDKAKEKIGAAYKGVGQNYIHMDLPLKWVVDIMKEDTQKDPLIYPEALHARGLINQKSVDRKLVKQTVMTSVYGVTYAGAREQIKRRLKERDAFADDAELFGAACYTSKVMAKRQKTAFPPNFFHSHDSSHMMMTAIACKKAGLNFAGVHDSYWTHACDVDEMNRILREKFVELYEAPILENVIGGLSKVLPYIVFPSIARTRGLRS